MIKTRDGQEAYKPDDRRVECAACGHVQLEIAHPLDNGGKYAWQCRGCGVVNEDGKVHLLQKTARFRSKRGL